MHPAVRLASRIGLGRAVLKVGCKGVAAGGGSRTLGVEAPWTCSGPSWRTQGGKGTHVASSTRRPSAGGDRAACGGRGGIRGPRRRRNARNQPVHDQEPA